MGQVQRSLGKKADPQIVMAELKKQLAKWYFLVLRLAYFGLFPYSS
jgi:hypothetical protein